MANLRILVFAGLGILIAIVALPQTRWVVRNHVDQLTGAHAQEYYYGLLNPSNWPTQGQEAELARAIQADGGMFNGKREPVRLKSLEEYCRRHSDEAVAWAHLARLATMAPLRPPNALVTQKPTAAAMAEKRRSEGLIELAVTNGEKLEPENLYFTFLKAALYESKGRHAEAEEAIRGAVTKTDYNDHTADEAVLMYKMASRKGYRGSALEMTVYASVLLPHLSSINQLLPYIAKDASGGSNPEIQAAIVRSAYVAARKTNNVITVIVMKAIARRVIAGEIDRAKVKHETDLNLRARAIDAKLGTNDIEKDLADFDRFNAEFPNIGDSDMVYEDGMGQSLIASLLLISLVLAVPITYSARGVSILKQKIGKSGRERDWLWCLFALIMVLSVSAILVGIFLQGYSNGIMALMGVPSGPSRRLMPGDFLAVGIILLAVSLIAIPRRPARVGVALVLAYSILPLAYLGSVIKTIQVDGQIKQSLVEFKSEASRYRGKW